MEIVPQPKKFWFRPSFNVLYDNSQELSDVVRFGSIMPNPTIAGLRTVMANSNTREYPVIVSYSDEQLREIAANLQLAAFQPEMVPDNDQARRLATISCVMYQVLDVERDMTQITRLFN